MSAAIASAMRLLASAAPKLSGGSGISLVTMLVLFAAPGRTIVYRDQHA